MEQLIFFAIIILFTIIESIARSRKKRMGGPLPSEPGQKPGEVRADWRRESTTASYDVDPSYDDLELEEMRGPASPSRGAGSEGMIPSDIWEEIAGLARSRMRQMETNRAPASPSRGSGGVTRAGPPAPPRPSRAKAPRQVAGEHRVHRAHADYGTDPSSRAPSAQDRLDPLARRLSADAGSVRRQLRVGGRHALRQAMILQEILGPPASLRPETHRDE